MTDAEVADLAAWAQSLVDGGEETVPGPSLGHAALAVVAEVRRLRAVPRVYEPDPNSLVGAVQYITADMLFDFGGKVPTILVSRATLDRLLVAERFAKVSLAVEDRPGLMPRPEITALFNEYAAACNAYRKVKETP